jgi:hypothetical protein
MEAIESQTQVSRSSRVLVIYLAVLFMLCAEYLLKIGAQW